MLEPDRVTVLLLEDDPDVLEATTLILEDEGFRVLSARDLESAQQLARGVHRCVILLDLSLEGDALKFVRELRESAEWDGQVLVFSAGDRLDERAAAIGADGALQKPFEVEHLISELKTRYDAVSHHSA